MSIECGSNYIGTVSLPYVRYPDERVVEIRGDLRVRVKEVRYVNKIPSIRDEMSRRV